MADKLLELKYTDHDGNEQTLNLYAKEMDPFNIPDHEEWTTLTTGLLRYHQLTTNHHWFRWEEINDELYYVSRTGSSSSWVTCAEAGDAGGGTGYYRPLAVAFRSRLSQYSTEIKDADPSLEQNRHIFKLQSASDRSKMFYEDGTFDETPPTNPYVGQKLTYVNDAGIECEAYLSLFVRNEIFNGTLTPISYNSGLYGFDPPGGILGPHGSQFLNTSRPYTSQDPPGFGIWHTKVKCDQDAPMQVGSASGGDGDLYGTEFDVFLMVLRNCNDQTYVAIIPESIFHAVDASEPTTDSPEGTNVTPSGWTGNWDFSSDFDVPKTPTGFFWANKWEHGINIYNLTSDQVDAFLYNLWYCFTIKGNLIAGLKETIFGNLDWIQGIITLHVLPCTVGRTGDPQRIHVFGNKLDLAEGRYIKTNSGQHVVQLTSKPLEIPHTIDDNVFLDYDNCSAYIMLPFVGKVPIDVKAFRGGALLVEYKIDILTGNCLAQVFATSKKLPGKDFEDQSGKQILVYQGAGNCAIHIPYVGNTEGGFKQLQALTGVGMAAIGAATGAAPITMAGAASAVSSMIPTGNTESHSYIASEVAPLMHPDVKLVIEGPFPQIPERQRIDWGYKAFGSAKISDFRKYPGRNIEKSPKEFLQGKVHANIDIATDAEKEAIERLFKEGVMV